MKCMLVFLFFLLFVEKFGTNLSHMNSVSELLSAIELCLLSGLYVELIKILYIL